MSIENEISSLTTAIRNLTDVLLASAAKSLPATSPAATVTVGAVALDLTASNPPPCTHAFAVADLPPYTLSVPAPAPEPKKTVKKEAAPAPVPTPTPAPAPAPTVSEDDLRVQIVELARPNMGDAAFKAFLGGKLSELQGAPCSISGTGKLPKIDAAHLPTLLASINQQLGK